MGFQRFCFCVGTPENDTNVDASFGDSLQDIEGCASSVRHLALCPQKCYRRPNAARCDLNRLANAAQCRFPIDERSNGIARTDGVRRHRSKRNRERTSIQISSPSFQQARVVSGIIIKSLLSNDRTCPPAFLTCRKQDSKEIIFPSCFHAFPCKEEIKPRKRSEPPPICRSQPRYYRSRLRYAAH